MFPFSCSVSEEEDGNKSHNERSLWSSKNEAGAEHEGKNTLNTEHTAAQSWMDGWMDG